MKWILACVAPMAIAGGIYWHGPLKSGATFARPATEVSYVLETMALPEAVEGSFGGTPSVSSRRETVPGKSVTYYFFARGAQAAKFVAEIDPVDEGHTRVSTRMTMSDDAEKLMKVQFMPMAQQFKIVGAAAMNEQIASRLERRPFNKDIVTKAMMGFAVANIGTIQRGAAEAMNEAQRVQDSLHSSDAPRIVPGRPMTDASTD